MAMVALNFFSLLFVDEALPMRATVSHFKAQSMQSQLLTLLVVLCSCFVCVGVKSSGVTGVCIGI